MSTARAIAPFVAALLLLAPLAGCESPRAKLKRIADAAPTAGRAVTLKSLRAGPDDGEAILKDAVLEAADRYIARRPALDFAAATLDLGRVHESKINRNAFLLRQSLALLAFRAADDAWRVRGDAALAADLVLAFPADLQTDTYWLSNPEHDALASRAFFDAGREQEAIERLEDRAGATETGAETLAELKRRRAAPHEQATSGPDRPALPPARQ